MSEVFDEKTLAYAAGLFDGEGSINIHASMRDDGLENRFALTAQVAITDVDVINFLWINFGGTARVQKGTNRDLNVWVVGSEEACLFLCLVYPFLIAKKKQAEYAIRYYKEVGQAQTPGQFMPEEIRLKRMWYKACLQAMHKYRPVISFEEYKQDRIESGTKTG